MKVLVTGGTGFVGSHAVAAIARAGHDVRLLVRSREQVSASLGALGVAIADIVVGDVLDEHAVMRAVDGCEAAVHAAAIFSLDPRRADDMRRTNARATELVLGGAAKRGLNPAVYVSTTVALARNGGSGPDLPLGDIDLPYAQSKIAAERIARQLQEDGAPVITIYPGAVYGPSDPYHGAQSEQLRWMLLGRFPTYPSGAQHVVDVRDVAALIEAGLQPGGPRRYIVPGHHVSGTDLYAAVTEAAGRRLPHVIVPGPVIGPSIRLIEAIQRRLPQRWHYPADREGVEIIRRDTRFDDSAARKDFDIQPLPFRQTIADTVGWLVKSGRVPAHRAPRLNAGPEHEAGMRSS
jgi:nucleoside-diphosphate-sugar epimerase